MLALRPEFVAVLAVLWATVGCRAEHDSSSKGVPAYPGREYNAGARENVVDGLLGVMGADYSSSRRDERGKDPSFRRQTWSFKSRRPIRRDDTGAYYYRFTLTETRYPDPRAAARAMDRAAVACESTGQVDAKGTVSYEVVAGSATYKLTTDCLMNRALEPFVTELENRLLSNKPPEPGSVVRYACGGNCRRL